MLATDSDLRESDLREIDLATAPAFLAAMREMIDCAPNRPVVIDCSMITFMDSSAYHALVEAHRYASTHDHLLVIKGLAPNCDRVIGICDDRKVLTVADVTERELVAWTGLVL
jgi:anti-anti-sigma factor